MLDFIYLKFYYIGGFKHTKILGLLYLKKKSCILYRDYEILCINAYNFIL